MAQERFINYKDGLISFVENRRHAGIIMPGRYRGFDTFTSTATLTFKLTHPITGFKHVSLLGVEEAAAGIWVTRQGSVIKETADVTGLVVLTNVANAFERIDYVIGFHDHSEVDGGSNATYAVIKGPTGGPVEPTLTDPESQILIGKLFIPASAANLTGVTYEMAEEPNLSNVDYARRDKENIFEKTQTYEYLPAGQSLISPDGAELLTLTDGNIFRVDDSTDNIISTITSKGLGTIIYLEIVSTITLKHTDASLIIDLHAIEASTFIAHADDIIILAQVGMSGDNGQWKVVGSSKLFGGVISKTTVTINKLLSTSDLLSFGVVGDTGAGKHYILYQRMDNSAAGLQISNLPGYGAQIAGYPLADSPLGVWKDIGFLAGDFTAGAGAWTIDAGDVVTYKFLLLDKTMFFSCYLNNTSQSGGPASVLHIKVPDGLVTKGYHMGSGRRQDSGGWQGLLVWTEDINDKIFIGKFDNSTFATGTNNIDMYISIAFEIS